MKKTVISVFGLLVVLLLVPARAEAAGKTEKAPAGPVKIVFWRSLTGAAGEAQDELVKRFNASQKQVEVESQFQGAYADLMQKMLAGLAAGTVPDVVMMDSPFMVIFAKDGALVELDSLVAADNSFDLKDFIPGLLQDGYYKGKLYALPYMRSTPLLYYNADMFLEAGLPDRAPETWEEFREFSRKLTKVEKGETIQYGTVFTMSRTTAHWYFQAAVYGYGGEVSDENFNIKLEEPPAIAAAKLWQDMVFKDKSAIGSNDPHAELLNKKAAMAFGSTGSMANLFGRAQFKVKAGFIPGQVRRQVPVGGAVITMSTKDRNKRQAAWEFMKYMTSADAQSYIVRTTGYMPISTSSMNHPDTVAYFRQYPERKIAIEQLPFARPQASVISLGKGTEILRQMVEKLLVGGFPPDQVMRETAQALRKEYEETFK